MAGTASAVTLSLFPERPPELEAEEIALQDLPADLALLGPPPDAALVASIRQCGVLQPVLLLRAGSGALLVADGRRRVKAARAAGLETVPARVAPDDGSLNALLSLVTHGTRHDNPAAELDAIEQLLQTGASEQAIARETGLSRTTIQRRLRLRDLEPRLRDAYRLGRLATGVAEAVAKLPPPAQARLAEQLGARGTLSGVAVADERRVRQAEAVVALPLALLTADAGTGTPSTSQDDAEDTELVAGWLEMAMQPAQNRHIREVVAHGGGLLVIHLVSGGACTIQVSTGICGRSAENDTAA